MVDDPAQVAVVETRLADRIAWCWSQMEAEVAPAPFILGGQPTVLDLYVTVVSRFRPGRGRLRRVAPRLNAVAERLDAEPRLADLWARRYPFTPGWDRA